MKFGYILPNFGDKISPQELLRIAKVCEEEGYDSVWATDHVIMPVELRDPYGELLEPVTTLSFVAGVTTRLRLGTSVVVITQRNPVLVAKQAATLDVFSGGRLILGLGAGWAEQEFGFLNMPFAKRGKVFDESISLMKALWSQDTVNFQGDFYKIKDAVFLPKPVRKDIPVWIGGNGATAVRRASTLGDGWHPVGPSLEDFAAGARKIRGTKRGVTLSMRMTVDVRKKREELTTSRGERRTVISGTAAELRKGIDGYAEAGLEYLCASMMHPSASEIIADLRKFAQDVIRSY